MILNDAARTALNSSRLAHLVTLNPDGSPQVSVVWVKAVGDELQMGHLGDGQKIRNLRRDPRCAVSIETGVRNDIGLDEYLIVHGHGEITSGGAPELLQELAHGYLGPDVTFPPMPDPPPGNIVRVHAERVGGVGPWTD